MDASHETADTRQQSSKAKHLASPPPPQLSAGGMAVETSRRDGPKQRTVWGQFTQQRLRSWQPIFSPKWIISTYIVVGLLFLICGTCLLLSSKSVTEYVYDYTEDARADTGVGFFDIHINEDMEPPIWIYYQLDGFHQNHRRYVKSRDDEQLLETDRPKTSARDLGRCSPAITSQDGRVLYPCGLVARSVFNDSYMLVLKGSGGGNGTLLGVDSRAETIAWAADTARFHNLDPERASTGEEGLSHRLALDMWIEQRFPPEECVQTEVSDSRPYEPVVVAMRNQTLPNGKRVEVVDCRWSDGVPSCNFALRGVPFNCTGHFRRVTKGRDWGIQNGHFIVWMRAAGLPAFRKIWGKLDTTLTEGSVLRVHFQDNFPVMPYRGRKAFVISMSSALGGRKDFLGYGYIVVGSCCLTFGLAFLLRHAWHGLRPLGDLSLLGPADWPGDPLRPATATPTG